MHENRKIYIVTKKKKSRKKLAIMILTPIFVLMLAGIGYVANLYNKAEQVANKSFESVDGTDRSIAELSTKVENTSILIIGVDDSNSRNYQDSTRSDALMVATFNKKDKSVKLLSIPRDSYVYVPEKGDYTKINHAYALNGPKSTIETVENLLDIPIDYYVRVNFYAFIDIVDALGGIEVDVPYEMFEKDSEDRHNAIHLQKGRQEVNGEEALAFARTRKQDTDMLRGQRQQEVIQAIVSKATSASSLAKYTNVLEAIGDNMKTNMTFSQMKAFMAFALKNKGLEIEPIQLQGEDDYINDIYYYKLDEDALEDTKNSLKAHLEGTNTASSSNLAQEQQPINEAMNNTNSSDDEDKQDL
ncbi:LCP family protein [Bacillus massiliigorillae]|uniref:LCP family protein n=1 Tax=Bacillus massiliigorillae TaxID=1243664 RepID=UPI0003A5966B|nr:LCP family protein [Bacillus massiliigorillae]